jgi:hypothetical protein
VIEAGAKANHLSYIGDAFVGANANHRRRHHHLQLRRHREAPHRDRRRRLHRLDSALVAFQCASASALISVPAR